MIAFSYQVKTITWIKSYLYLWVYTQKGFSAGGTVWSSPWPSRPSIMAPGGRDLGRIYHFFEILDKAGDINNSTSKPNYCDESYCDLGMYVHKVPSAWGKVWYSAFKGRLLWLPGVAILAEF